MFWHWWYTVFDINFRYSFIIVLFSLLVRPLLELVQTKRKWTYWVSFARLRIVTPDGYRKMLQYKGSKFNGGTGSAQTPKFKLRSHVKMPLCRIRCMAPSRTRKGLFEISISAIKWKGRGWLTAKTKIRTCRCLIGRCVPRLWVIRVYNFFQRVSTTAPCTGHRSIWIWHVQTYRLWHEIRSLVLDPFESRIEFEEKGGSVHPAPSVFDFGSKNPTRSFVLRWCALPHEIRSSKVIPALETRWRRSFRISYSGTYWPAEIPGISRWPTLDHLYWVLYLYKSFANIKNDEWKKKTIEHFSKVGEHLFIISR